MKTGRLQEWRVEAFRLRLKGYDYREIAEKLSMTPTAVQRLVREQIESQRPTREQVDEIRTIELSRLDYMTRRLLKRIEGDLRDDSAYSILLKVSERRARIAGIDAPKTSFQAVAVVTDLPAPELKRRAEQIMQENQGFTVIEKSENPGDRS